MRCTRCASAVTGAPAPAQAHETGTYANPDPFLSTAAGPVLGIFDRQRLRLIAHAHPPGRRLLDVGAGRGRFVAAARRAGYDASGLEPASRGRGAPARYGVSLLPETLQRAPIEQSSQHVITLWHVLEHVEDPDAAIARVTGWLAPGGVLVVGVPNLNSLQARVTGGRWYHLDLPRHRTHFTPAGLGSLLTRHGLAVGATHHVLAEHNPFGMWQSLLSLLTRRPSYLFARLKGSAPGDVRDLAVTLLGLPLLPVAATAELAAGVARRGGTVAMVARTGPSGSGSQAAEGVGADEPPSPR